MRHERDGGLLFPDSAGSYKNVISYCLNPDGKDIWMFRSGIEYELESDDG